jgi:hypothetical protein
VLQEDIRLSTLSNAEIWSILLEAVSSQARPRIEILFVPKDVQPPFLSFVLEAVERDAAIGHVSPASGPLMDSGLVIHALSEPPFLELADAIRLAKAAVKLDYRLDDKLLNRLTGSSRWPAGVPKAECVRVLEIIDAISDCQRLVLPLMRFLKLPPHQLRSKAVKLIARARRNPGWAESILADPDPRVRSNLIDGLAQQRGEQIDILLRKGAADPHHRVSIAALLQLCQRGDQPSCEKIRRLAREGDPPNRRAAEWALTKIDSPNPSDDAAEASVASDAAPDVTIEPPVALTESAGVHAERQEAKPQEARAQEAKAQEVEPEAQLSETN